MVSEDQRRCRFRFGGAGFVGDPGSSRAETAECVAYIDSALRTIDLTVDAEMREVTLGFRLDYTNRHNRVGTLTGSKQFQIGLFGRFEFMGGTQAAGFR
jgi:hypothetical protein